MKIETLKERIKKAEEKLIKINGTLERHNKQLEKKAKVLTEQGIDPNNCDRFDYRQTQTYWDICDYESKKEDIKSNEKKIAEVNKTLENLKEQLKNQLAKESEIENAVPEVLNIFLENWKQKCIGFYVDLANRYIELKSKSYKEYEITREELEQLKKKEYNKNIFKYELVKRFTDEEIKNILQSELTEDNREQLQKDIKNRYIETFINSHFSSDMYVLTQIVKDGKYINMDTLNEILDRDVKEKKEMFVSRIKEVIGEIKDLTGLEIGDNGDINGIAKGVKSNAMVKTITAGGYNIQCYHFRVLVNTVK